MHFWNKFGAFVKSELPKSKHLSTRSRLNWKPSQREKMKLKISLTSHVLNTRQANKSPLPAPHAFLKSREPELVWPVAQVSWDCLWFFQSDKDSASETGLPRR